MKKEQSYFQGVYDKLKKKNADIEFFLKYSKKGGTRLLMPQEAAENESLCEQWKEFGTATAFMGLEKPLWMLWKQGGNSSSLLRAEIKRNHLRMDQAKDSIRSANKIIESREKSIASQIQLYPYTEKQLKDRMKSLRKEGSALKLSFIKLYLEEIKVQQKNIKIFGNIWTSLQERNKKLKAYIIERMGNPKRKRRIATRLLTPQEAETVIFW